ncbi:hypothetical protein [Alkalicoccus luteus]|uniref:Uncharacterized protein n=1 Tax=Alkalicoccus luteus TaxID=1237094 RepID=A0A969PMH4_9BACI|nr:hypothetical protein [Alkalicoccus luteus]NJP36911.1 hypothetical protein [Alkalicoccus luteus]
MQKQKLLILGAGAVVLLILSTVLFMMDSDQQVIQSDQVSNGAGSETAVQEENDSPDDATGSEGGSISVESTENNAAASLDEEEEEEYRSRAEDALDEYTPSDYESFSYEAFESHAYLYTIYQQQAEDSVIEQDAIQSNSELLALELEGWNDYAVEEYGFTFNEQDFLQYVEGEQESSPVEEADVRILVEELEAVSSTAASQQLEFQYARPYIWSQIQDEAAADAGVSPEETSEWNQLYFEIEQRVFERIADSNPTFMEGEPE